MGNAIMEIASGHTTHAWQDAVLVMAFIALGVTSYRKFGAGIALYFCIAAGIYRICLAIGKAAM